MMTLKGSALSDKKDLHVGGMGQGAPAAFAVPQPWGEQPADAAAQILQRVRAAIQNADSMVRVNPWAAVGLGACVGLTAGYFLSRRL